MISIRQQVERGLLVCPQTKTRLNWRADNVLVSDLGSEYRTTSSGVPILLLDAERAQAYAAGSRQMLMEYGNGTAPAWARMVAGIKGLLRRDYRTKSSRFALKTVLDSGAGDHVCLSIGGGPLRISPHVTNLNIGCFPNVDVVADAHVLPYADSSVDSIYCEAVLEHLSEPTRAAEEMYRVLKPGGKLIAITPFLQRFHGYPYHFQNFTLLGHSLLFTRLGFTVLERGTCVGPTYAIVSLVSAYCTQCLPKIVGLPLAAVWNFAGVCLLPLDSLINRTASSHLLASTTYVLAEKPAVTIVNQAESQQLPTTRQDSCSSENGRRLYECSN